MAQNGFSGLVNNFSNLFSTVGETVGGIGGGLVKNTTSLLDLPSKLLSGPALIIMAVMAVVLIPVVAPLIMKAVESGAV